MLRSIRYLFFSLTLMFTLGLHTLSFADESGFNGKIYDKESIKGIKGAIVTFTAVMEPDKSYSIATEDWGRFKIVVPPGKYFVLIEHQAFKSFQTAPGFFEVKEGIIQVANIPLTRKVDQIYVPGPTTESAKSGFLGSVYEKAREELAVDASDIEEAEESMPEEKLTGGEQKDLKVIDGVTIYFIPEGDKEKFKAISNKKGLYKIGLPKGNYKIIAEHDNYKAFSTTPDRIEQDGKGYHSYTIYLEPKLEEEAKYLESVNESDIGFLGTVYEHLEDDEQGERIDNVTLIFSTEDGKLKYKTVSNQLGFYVVGLPEGSYHITATREGYEPFTTMLDIPIATKEGFDMQNILMKPVTK